MARNRRGLTLLELMVQVSLIGILTALAAPSLLPLARTRQVDNDLEAVEGILQAMQSVSIRTSSACTVRLAAGRVDSSNCQLSTYAQLQNTALSASATNFSFDFQGNLTSSVVVILAHNANTNLKKCLVLQAPLGLIRRGTYTGNGTTANNCT
jgi:prepilin-type N-terminal cleavage/methylation domain-containing protein